MDDKSGGALGSLIAGMIQSANGTVVDCCWANFKHCVKSNGTKYESPVKSVIDIYAKVFNLDANQGVFASVSFKDGVVWNWNATVLDDWKAFLGFEVL